MKSKVLKLNFEYKQKNNINFNLCLHALKKYNCDKINIKGVRNRTRNQCSE